MSTIDKSNFFIKKYHLSNHLLIPGILTSLVINNFKFKNDNYVKNSLLFANGLNIGYHSYFSMSTIITDYVKPKNLAKIVRGGNLGLHGLAFLGIARYLKNKE